ncbi:hypothetical protein SASPL_115956 [Salvia splendens]|uniref:Uncharacterized protein n=1 Tax=Salvia splendens TaxID=180675 RepID=A0A8X8Y4Q7_SALSN|nr:uncharacterized protein LOC121804309 [Salvia splendens]KAG6425515.1 hypothetical protein SASPL_115956 [Salvia splendens]
MRNKGKVHPSPNSTTTAAADAFSLLKLLPAAILSLLTILSLQEREALAYMLSISLHSSSSAAAKKPPQCPHNSPPLLHCDCFHCYTAFWLRWDSSPNRLLIHRAIDAFELDLTSAAAAAPKIKKRRDKFSRWSKPSSPENQERRISAASPPPAEAEVGELSIPGVSVEKTAAAAPSHKGLARKVLPDVMGIFSSRLWRLWSPNV